MRTRRSRLPLCAVAALAMLCAAATAADDCVQIPDPAAGLTKAAATAAGPAVDIGNVTVIELDGDYGKENSAPRMAVARRFYETHPDRYDFLVVFTTFEFEMGDARAFHNLIRNDTQGIGRPIFDMGQHFGSAAKLQGYIDMAAMSRNSFVSSDAQNVFLLRTFAHELMHRWGSHLSYRTDGGETSRALFGYENSHWSYFLDSDASLMLGNDWRRRDDGRYESVAIRQRFSALDLYVAGFAAASEVPPMTLIQGGDGAATALPRLGAISGGSGETVRIEQIIAAEGARVPDAAHSPKDFRAALILLKRPGEILPATTLPALENARVRLQQYFNQVTEGRASVRLFNEPLQAAAPQLPTILSGSLTAATPPGVSAAVDWIKQRQLPDGHWQDRAATALRDTTTALHLLQQVEPGWSGLAAARSWIAAQQPTSFDAQSWKLQADPQAGVDSLLAAQSADGGWGIAAGFADANLDTAGVAEALAQRDANSDGLRRALLQLGSRQNSDGSFAIGSSGRGRLLPTLRAARLFAASTQPGHQTIRDAATQWIAARQRADGAFADAGTRNDESALADTIELYRLVGRLPLPVSAAGNARDYVIAAQGSAGDWQGSVYLTARAALAQLLDNKANLALQGVVEINPLPVVDGDVVQLRARIVNGGNRAAAASIARWYDGDPDHGGQRIGGDQIVPALAAGASATVQQTWDSSGRGGTQTLWLLLDADDGVAEQNESDNRIAIPVVVGAAPTQADIALDASRFTIDPAAIAQLPTTVGVSGEVRNLGATPVPSVRLVLYADGTPAQRLAETTMALPARGAAPLQLSFTATAAQTLHLRLVADPDNTVAEARENNNDAQWLLPFGPSVDLEVRATDLSLLDGTPTQGRDVGFRVQLRNRGTVAVAAAALHIGVLQNAGEDSLFDGRVAIDAGQTLERRVYWRARDPGAATLQVTIDATGEVAETDESNNSASLPFTVAAGGGSDLAIVADSLQFTPNPALQGQPLQLRLRLRNLGYESAAASTLALYASDPRSGGTRLGQVGVAGLAGQAETEVVLDVADLDLAGDTGVFVVADADQQIAEADESNNLVLRTLNVLPFADVAVSSAAMTLVPSQPAAGAPLQVSAVVRNLGAQPARDVVVRLYEGSQETGVAAGAEQVIAELAAGGETTVSWNWTFGLQPGARQLTLVADPANAVRENRKQNNLAILPLALQESGFYASERYFSPNGDGVRDATALFFARPAPGRLDVVVRNASGRAVRRFDDVGAGADSGQLVWDGRDERGRVVADGVYLAELQLDGQRRTALPLTVDTDRSSLVAAIDSPLLGDAKLPESTGWWSPPSTPATRNTLFARTRSADPLDPTLGLYRTSTLLPTPTAVVSARWVRERLEPETGELDTVDAAQFSPDGRWIAFYLHRGSHYQLAVAATEQTDQVFVLDATAVDDADAYRRQPPRFLDANRVLAGALPQLQVYDLQTRAKTAFRDLPADSAGLRLYAHGAYVWRLGGNELRPDWYAPLEASRPVVALPAAEPGQEFRFLLNEDGTRAIVSRYTGAAESLHLFRAETGTETPLQQRTPQPLSFAALPEPGHLPTLQAQWISADDSLLLIDAAAHRVEIRTRDGAVRTSAPLPATDPTLDLGPDPARFNGEHRRADTLYDGADCDETRTNCLGALWADTDRRRQWFDPATRTAVVLLASHHIGPVDCEVGRCFGHAPATLEAFAIDVDDGSSTRLAATQTADRLPADLQPRLRLRDGGVFATDGRYGYEGRLSTQPWRYAAAVASHEPAFSDDDAGLRIPGSPRERSIAAMTNLTALLQAESSDRAVLLSGIAADLNFAYYQLDWALPSAPTQWHAITPPQNEAVPGDEFLSWVPPQPGHYLVRLTVVDKAGNATTRTASALSLFGSPVVEVGLDSRYFSPNGDGVKDTATVHFRSVAAAQIRIRVRNTLGAIVREQSSVLAAGLHDFAWDGRDDAGQLQPDGDYSIDVEGQKLRVVLDTVAPVIEGHLIQPNLPWPEGSPRPNYFAYLYLDTSVSDANGNDQRYELRDAAGGSWQEALQDIFRQLIFNDYVGLAGKSARVIAEDWAGNRATREFASPVEQLLFANCDDRSRSCKARHVYPATSIGPISYPADFPALAEDIDEPEHFRLWLQDGTPGFAAIQIEIADAQRPGEWSVFATLPGTLPPFAFEYGDRGFELHLPLHDLPQGADRRLRAVGIRADGSRLYGDQLRVLIKGLGTPVVLCPGKSPASLIPAPAPEILELLSLQPDQVQVVAPVSYDGVAQDLQLRLGESENAIRRGDYRVLRPSAHNARHAYFRFSPATLGLDASAEFNANLLQASGRLLSSAYSGLGCGAGGTTPPRTEPLDLAAVPVLGERCSGIPTQQLQFVAGLTKAVPDHYDLTLTGRDGAQSLLDETPTANDTLPYSGWSWQRRHVISTAALAEGDYRVTATARRGTTAYYADGNVEIDHDAPQLALESPAGGSRICAARDRFDAPSLRATFDLRSDSAPFYQFALTSLDDDGSDVCVDNTGAAQPGQCSDRNWLSVMTSSSGIGELSAAGTSLRALNGNVEAQLRGTNASGAVVCSNRRFYLDSTVELGLGGAPEPALGTYPPDLIVVLPTIAGEAPPDPRPPLLGLSTNGSPRFRQATVPLVARETLDYRASVLTLLPVIENGHVSHYYPGNEIAALGEGHGVSGAFALNWDGRIGGTPAADGYYLIRVQAEDTCGWTSTSYYLVDVDSTPPAVAITDPLAGAVPTDAVVAIRGTVTDAHFSSFSTAQPYWELAVEQAGQTQLVGQGEEAVTQPAVLGRWSRGAAQQAGHYQLVAADDFGNRSEIRQPFAAPTPLVLLARAQLLPELFSPNGDGRLDRSELRIDLLAPALVDLRIRNEGGAVVATLALATAMPAGTTRLDWNGSGLPDGNYQIEVVAQSAATPELRESAQLAAVLDTRAPQLSVLTPAGDVAGAAGTVTFRIDETYPDRFDARLLADGGDVQAQLAGGGSGVQTLATLSGRADGRYRIAIQAQDRAGNRSEIEQSFVLDTTAPQAALNAPIEDSVLPRGGAAVSIAGTATDAQFESYKVELLPGNSQSGLLLASGSSAVEAAELGRWTVTEADGDYRLRLSVRDRAGNERTVERRIAIDGTPPQVMIDAPVDGAALAGRLRLLGTVQDAHLRDYVVAIATPSAALADSWTPLYRGLAAVNAGVLAEVDLPLPDGDYVLRVVATDVTGATASARRDLRIDKAPPPAPLQLRVQVNGADATLDWSPPAAGDLAGYAIYRNGARLNATSQTTPHYVDPQLPDGRWRYQVTALDQAGNESAPSNAVEIDVDRTPPTAEIHAPLSGTRVHGVVPVIATAYSADDFDSFVLTARRRDGGDTPRVLAQGSLPQRNQLLAQWDSLTYAENTTVVLRLSARDRSGQRSRARDRPRRRQPRAGRAAGSRGDLAGQ
ncbi:CARDB domain-containing protein [Tahibacter sp. UC22_41]|uniref:CARDB domain-containing protein n=1 Tax=Tahibacter sp. UC22_41 TaxID=3350178 RepID=UPI0036DD6D75